MRIVKGLAAGEVVLVHSSDLHLSTRVAPGRAGMAVDPLADLRRVLDGARMVQADCVLLVGDVFDDNRQPKELLDQAAGLMGEADRTVLILPGNHDPLTPDSVYRRGAFAEHPNVRVLGLEGGDTIVLEHLDLEVRGQAHRDYTDMPPLPMPSPRRARWRVVMAHAHFVEPAARLKEFRGSWLFDENDVRQTDADYLALGHWNRPACVSAGAPHAYYSGSPEYTDTVNVVRLGRTGTVQVHREPLQSAPILGGAVREV